MTRRRNTIKEEDSESKDRNRDVLTTPYRRTVLGGIASGGLAGCAETAQRTATDYDDSTPDVEPGLSGPTGELLDAIDVGNSESEQAHNLMAKAGEQVVQTLLADRNLSGTGRRLQPRGSASETLDGEDWMGGWTAFDIAVDPEAVTYLTVRMWGTDESSGKMSVLLDTDASDETYRWIDRGVTFMRPFWRQDWTGPERNQWQYRTYALPPEITEGTDELRLRLQQIGDNSTRTIYNISTHTNPQYVPPEEQAQGEPFQWGQTHGDVEEILDSIDTEEYKRRVQERIEKVMDGDVQPSALSRFDQLELADIYHTEWSGYYQDEAIIHRVKELVDKQANEWAKTQSPGHRWAGRGRGAGRVFVALHEGFEESGVLEETIELDTGDRVTRREAYIDFFKGEFDAFIDSRRSFTNQTYWGNVGLYFLNKALLKLDADVALSEARARWLLTETFGMTAWGPDLEGPHGGPNRGDGTKLASGYPLTVVTDKGLTRERGYVESYGEYVGRFSEVAGDVGDPALLERAAQMAEARAHMRSPYTTGDGYRNLQRIGVLGWRNKPYPGGKSKRYFDKHAIYNLRDPVPARMAQLSIEHEGEDSDYLSGNTIRDFEVYQVLTDILPTDYRLPFEGQKRYAWADEENGIFMINHGDELLWGSFYMPGARNGIHTRGRIRHMTPRDERVVDLENVAKAPETGEFSELDTNLEAGHENVTTGRKKCRTPTPQNWDGWGGEDARELRMGRAWYYQATYGNYVIGMNTTHKDHFNATLYQLDVPEEADGQTATDLISGRSVDLSEPVVLPPRTTMVLYLEGSEQ